MNMHDYRNYVRSDQLNSSGLYMLSKALLCVCKSMLGDDPGIENHNNM